MARKPKSSRRSLHLSSNHDYSDDSSPFSSQPPYESNEEYDDYYEELQPPINSRDQYSSNSASTFQTIATITSSSYINVAPLPIFHGNPNECPITHLTRFVKVCRANNASSTDMMMRIFPVTLENEAALWYDLNIEPYYSSLSWDEIKLSFVEAYHRIELVEQLRSDLVMLNQGDEECVRSYFLRLQWILKRWPDHGLTENMLKGVFIDGLKEDFQEWIVPQKPSSLHEALRLAFSFEQVKSVRGVKQEVVKCGFCDGLHEEKLCEVRKRMRAKLLRKSDKEKEMMVYSEEGSESDGGEKDEEENEEETINWKKMEKKQCQCSKHQCWKKKLERNNSVISRNSTAE